MNDFVKSVAVLGKALPEQSSGSLLELRLPQFRQNPPRDLFRKQICTGSCRPGHARRADDLDGALAV